MKEEGGWETKHFIPNFTEYFWNVEGNNKSFTEPPPSLETTI